MIFSFHCVHHSVFSLETFSLPQPEVLQYWLAGTPIIFRGSPCHFRNLGGHFEDVAISTYDWGLLHGQEIVTSNEVEVRDNTT
jgi:hypothetical protein